jgi:5-methyltetrahydrofolate--homocysteine methyltransferase
LSGVRITDSLPTAEQIGEAKARLRSWWNSEAPDQPVLDLTARREPRGLEQLPEPNGWLTAYSATDLAYRAYLSRRHVASRTYHAEALPIVRPDLGPSSLAALLGSTVTESPDNIWFGPCMDDASGPASISFSQTNPYWRFTLELLARQQAIAPGIVTVGYPDLGENLDVLACMRGTQELLMDTLDRPEWVTACLQRIDATQALCYDTLAERIADVEASIYHWMWAPGRTGRFQCDISAMLSPEAFEQFMVPCLQSLCARHDHTIYHWDGVDALVHERALLTIDALDVIQWVPGAGQRPVHDPHWWPLYHRIFDAGKRVALVGFAGVEQLAAMRKAFGSVFGRFFLRMHVKDPSTAHAVVCAARGES